MTIPKANIDQIKLIGLRAGLVELIADCKVFEGTPEIDAIRDTLELLVENYLPKV